MEFNKSWKFLLEDIPSGHLLNLQEDNFQEVDLPHDYSILQPYNQEIGDGCTGYLVGGIGWYRKSFKTTPEMKKGKVFVCFDGIYNRSNIYINEHFVAFHPYGYAPLLLDITKYLNAEDNVLAVKVDHSRYADSRWYTGSGIYRKVSLHVLPKLYIPVWGMQVRTEDVSKQEATLCVNLEVKNEMIQQTVEIATTVYDPDGIKVSENKEKVTVDEALQIEQKLVVKTPVLWGIHQGNLYTVNSKIILEGKCIQEKNTKIGIRYFIFDANKGFFINGNHELIKGVCLHHDGGAVGAAVPKDVWKRRLEILIEGGCNAIRTAHNPASEEFLDLCDELGLLVQEEFYDEWDNPKDKRFNMQEKKVDYITRGHHEFFKDYAEQDLKAVVARDFNHPCIFQWSIGNEIEWTYPKYVMATGYFDADANGNYFWEEPPYSVEEIRERVSKLPRELYEVGDTAQKLAKWTREMDTTRPIIANCILPSASYESGYTDALDMVGFSYRQVVYERCHTNYPDKPIMGTENLAQWHEWKQVLDKPYIPGIFLWTGVDYIGESSNADMWPRKAMPSGLLDVAGFKNPQYYMFQALWTEKACIHMTTQTVEKSIYKLDENGELVDKEGCEWDKRLWYWQPVNEHWNYQDGEEMVVEVYSNCQQVTLYVNDKEISTKSLSEFPDRIYKWKLPYAVGTLKAVGTKSDEQVEAKLVTTSAPIGITVVADKYSMCASRNEVIHVEALLIDVRGNSVANQEEEIEFIVEGEGVQYVVDNGSANFVGDHKCLRLTTNKGKALLILKGRTNGQISVSAKMKNTTSNIIRVEVIE